MLVQRDALHRAYQDLRSLSSASRPVLVQVGPDADAVCACATITALLRIDQIPYRITPVHSYEDLGRSLEGAGALILINCGATVDLQQHLDGVAVVGPDFRVYVLDSHRPYHLANVRSDNDQIVCMDAAQDANIYPEDHDLSSDDNDDDADRRQRIQRRIQVAEHYGGTYFDQSAAVLAYDLAQQLHKDDGEMLWSAIVGLTDQYLFDRIPRWSYLAQAHQLRRHVFNQAKGDDRAVLAPGDAESQVRVPAAGTIAFEAHDLQFTLVRHWTLYDAMSHSRRLATRLKLWRDTGTQQLNLLLAKLGIPRQESCSPYVLMRADCKKRLHEDLAKYAGEYGLEPHDLFLPAFTRRYADGLAVSAGDLVLIMTAVFDSSSLISAESGFWAAIDTLRAGQTLLLRKSLPMAVDLQEKVFHRAHALLSKRAITSTGKYRLCIMDSGEVQQVFARPLALTQLGLFLIDAYEQVLGEQSAAHRSRKRPRRRLKILPFVLCAEIEQRHSYLVVGIVRSGDQQTEAEIQRNMFSVAFTDAAILTKARARQDGFEASVVEIAKDDLKPFLESLVHQM